MNRTILAGLAGLLICTGAMAQSFGDIYTKQMPDNQKGSLRVRVCAMKRVRVRYHHPIHIMDVSERSDTCLVHDKQYQQAQCTYNFFLLLHVQKLIL